jgi:putative transposase
VLGLIFLRYADHRFEQAVETQHAASLQHHNHTDAQTMTKFTDKYRVESVRLRGWDYASMGWYFVTICTHQRACMFGRVVKGDVELSPAGEIVAEEWQRTAQVRLTIDLDAWIIMPNHVHGIITIKNDGLLVETPRRGVSTNAWKPNSLGAIVNQIKSVCTKRIRAAGYPDFAWQARFHDHIIRDEPELNRIRRYIHDNPLTWTLDDLYAET